MADVRSSLARRRCSFCGKNEDQVHRLIAGPGKATICGQCVQLCFDMMSEKSPDLSAAPRSLDVLPTPQRIMEQLNQYVVGQDRAKKVLSVAVYNHYKRVAAGMQIDDVELGKSNILLLGPTGSGKTLLAQTLARILDVPFCIADATALTEAGYVGEDVESILLRLLEAAEFDVERAQKGIVYIDEIDKIARKSENPSLGRDVSGEGVQQALLKIVEGTVANIAPQGGRKHPQQDYIHLNTTNILFLCGGAFDGIEHIIAQRTNGRRPLGFRAGPSAEEKDRVATPGILPEDLLHFGLIPEFIGRLPVIVGLDSLDRDDLTRILTEPKNSLVKQYTKLLALDQVELIFTAEALDQIAAQALGQRTGARGLRTIVEEALLDVMFELPSRDDVAACIVTDRVILAHEPPLLETAARPPSADFRAVTSRSA